MKNNIEEQVNAEDMIEKLGLEKRNSFLGSVIWRNWIIPIFIGALFILLVMVVFTYMKWDEFVGGQVSMLCFFIIHKISSIQRPV